MIRFDAIFGEGRLGAWLRDDPFSVRGRYEEKDAAGTVGRMADWLEASCLFGDEDHASFTDVFDEIRDSGLVEDDENELRAIAESIFAEVQRRGQLLGGASIAASYPFEISSDLIRRQCASWRETPVYSFLLCASIVQHRPAIVRTGSSYDKLGHLFESVAAHAYSGVLGGAALMVPVRRGAPSKEQHISLRLAPTLKELNVGSHPAFAKAPTRVNDGGLDLVGRFNLGDSRPGGSFFLVQCAAGLDWAGKLATPNEATWREWVDWRGPLWRSFCVPFVFKDDATLRDASRDGGWQLILDRPRIARGCVVAGDLASNVRDEVVGWLESRMPLLAVAA